MTMRVVKGDGFAYATFRGETGDHIVWYDRDGISCSCLGYLFRGKCKHVGEFMRLASVDDVSSNRAMPLKLPSSLNVVNKLFGEEAYNSDVISALFGKPSMGKTLLAFQDSEYIASLGHNVLYIDTEGSASEMIRKWHPIFKERFKIERGKVYLLRIEGIEELMKVFGLDVHIERKKGKLEFRVESDKRESGSEIEKTLEDYNIKFMVIDSISEPLRIFTTAQQDAPAKADATAQLMHSIKRLMNKMDIPVLVTAHASFNPANPYETGAEVRGGIVVKHTVKRLLYIDRREKKGLENYRRLWLVRSADTEEWKCATVVKITDLGYFDVNDPNEIREVFTDTELKRLYE